MPDTFTTFPSTDNWREYWREQSRIDHTDWSTLPRRRCRRWRSLHHKRPGAVIMICATCGSDPCANPDFCQACRDANRRKTRLRYAPLPPAPPIEDDDLPKADLGSKDWKALAAEAWASPTWKQAALKYRHARGNHTLIAETPPEDLARLRRLMEDDISPERAWDEINRAARARYNAAPQSTVEALIYSLRRRGVKALQERDILRRLSDLSDQQVIEVGNRLQKLKPEIARACSAEEVETLFKVKRGL